MNSLTYREMVRKYADNQVREIIPNGGLEHARVLIANLFSHAQGTVRIFSSKLHQGIYKDFEILASGKKFLSGGKDRRLEILFQEVSDITEVQDHPFVGLCKAFSGQCDLRGVAESDKHRATHFVIMDEVGFRFCPDKAATAAIGTFNHPEVAENLVKQFTIMFNRAKSFPLAQSTA